MEGSQNMGNRCFMFLSEGLPCPQGRGTVFWPGFSEFVCKIKINQIETVDSALYLFK